MYRFTAAALAEVVSAVPALEGPFVRLGARVWGWRGMGRFYRSVAGRYADRLRESGSPFRRVLIGDTSLIVDVTEFTTITHFFGNVPYEPATTEYLRRHLARGDVFVDVGANHGYFTLIAAALVGERGRVFAFEPNPPVFKQLAMHVSLNSFDDRVVLLPAALSDVPDDQARFFVSQWSRNSGISTLRPTDSTIADGGLSREHTISIRADTFDRWFAASRLDRVDLVKIDAEGSEELVLRGMSEALRSGRVRAVICETTWDGPAHRLLCAAGLLPAALESFGPVTNIVFERQPS
jgi:FkbM family methyltransferase